MDLMSAVRRSARIFAYSKKVFSVQVPMRNSEESYETLLAASHVSSSLASKSKASWKFYCPSLLLLALMILSRMT